MKLLAVETATQACSAALFVDGKISERFEIAPRAHTQRILPMVEALLADAQLSLKQLDGLAFACGPGSFTGLRIATGVIHGLAFGLDLPVVGVSTLRTMAQACFTAHAEVDVALVALDARMDELFWGVYQRDVHGFAQSCTADSVLGATQVSAQGLRGMGIGSGWLSHGELLHRHLGDAIVAVDGNCLPRAYSVVQLAAVDFKQGLAVGVEQAMPVYLRNKVAQTLAERKT